MEREPLLIVLDGDPSRGRRWAEEDPRSAPVIVAESADDAVAAARPNATLIVRCAGYEVDDVLPIVERARCAEQPVAVLLLTDEGDRYRDALRARGLVAEVLTSATSVGQVGARLGLRPTRRRTGGNRR